MTVLLQTFISEDMVYAAIKAAIDPNYSRLPAAGELCPGVGGS